MIISSRMPRFQLAYNYRFGKHAKIEMEKKRFKVFKMIFFEHGTTENRFLFTSYMWIHLRDFVSFPFFNFSVSIFKCCVQMKYGLIERKYDYNSNLKKTYNALLRTSERSIQHASTHRRRRPIIANVLNLCILSASNHAISTPSFDIIHIQRLNAHYTIYIFNIYEHYICAKFQIYFLRYSRSKLCEHIFGHSHTHN